MEDFLVKVLISIVDRRFKQLHKLIKPPYVNALATKGFVLGNYDYIKPNAPLTRAQFAALLYRILQLTEK
ncbi:S-layer homology domain-containing protein [Lysinibacillus sp. NPDC097231]|uniref:S-layer homology domain-containing protein n=1 Tax=Lysinibacillus sp. NPDC097231 TaxID=3364142 RepID=UPI0038147A49